jgi:hypothetical protein
MFIYDKSQVKPLKINGKNVIIKYDDLTSNKYELYFDNEVSNFHSKIYVYNTGTQYIFGEYIEYRNIFKDLANIDINQNIFNFLLKNTTNV